MPALQTAICELGQAANTTVRKWPKCSADLIYGAQWRCTFRKVFFCGGKCSASSARNPPREHFALQCPDLEAAFLPSNGSVKSKLCNFKKDSGFARLPRSRDDLRELMFCEMTRWNFQKSSHEPKRNGCCVDGVVVLCHLLVNVGSLGNNVVLETVCFFFVYSVVTAAVLCWRDRN